MCMWGWGERMACVSVVQTAKCVCECASVAETSTSDEREVWLCNKRRNGRRCPSPNGGYWRIFIGLKLTLTAFMTKIDPIDTGLLQIKPARAAGESIPMKHSAALSFTGGKVSQSWTVSVF